MPSEPAILVLDVGKTHIKLHVLDQQLQLLWSRQRRNEIATNGPYPHIDIATLWRWFINGAGEAAAIYNIQAISIATHGATAALIDSAADAAWPGLVLPVVDYEFAGIAAVNERYRRLRPAFRESLSPELPAGLNLGRQLFWLQETYPEDFGRADTLLLYPQYWGWLLTGVAASEVSSLGCHTDCWAPAARTFSTLVKRQQWQRLFPPFKKACDVLGTLRPAVIEQTGLPRSCRVFVGVHDSNASYLRYLPIADAGSSAVVSTGTWTITFARNAGLQRLDERRDMLANVDIHGNAVGCARFMGGREYQAICAALGLALDTAVTAADIQRVIHRGSLALPDFSGGSGPFAGAAGRIIGAADAGAALATLYCVLMIEEELSLLGVSGAVYVEGAFLQNPWLCRLLAQLRSGRPVLANSDSNGTVQGAALLTQWQRPSPPSTQRVSASRFAGLAQYQRLWRSHL